jgi:hypothetical protein
MRYKSTLNYDQRDKFLQEIQDSLTEGIWLVDLDPRADVMLLGPYESIADAHDDRDFIWHYGDKFGRYLWYVNVVNAATIKKLIAKYTNDSDNKPMVELNIDTLPFEITGIRLIGDGKSYRIPKVRKKNSNL